jgi:hypothetical protein
MEQLSSSTKAADNLRPPPSKDEGRKSMDMVLAIVINHTQTHIHHGVITTAHAQAANCMLSYYPLS